MPQNVKQRGGSFGAQARIAGQVRWLGSFPTRAQAKSAVKMAKAPGPRRVQPPSSVELEQIATAMGERVAELAVYVRVAAWSGLRVSEVAALEWRDLIERDGMTMLHVRSGKGSKERHSVLLEPGIEALDELVSTRHPRRLMFTTARGTAWSKRSVNYHWCELRKEGLLPREEAVFHDLRKFHATYLLNAGAADIDVAVQLGHFDKYGRPNADLVRRIYGFVDNDRALCRIGAVRA